MKCLVLLLLLAFATAMIAVPRPFKNELSKLQIKKAEDTAMAKGYFMRGKRHSHRCKTKLHSTSFSLQTRLAGLAFAKSSAHSKHGSHHRLDC